MGSRLCYTKWMIEITPTIFIDEKDLQFDYIRSSGPGGQNINKVATGVQLRYNLVLATSLPGEVKLRLRSLARNRISEDGILIIEAKRYRTQEQNRDDAVSRLTALVLQAAEKPRPRRKTKPSAASQADRIEAKKRRGSIKHFRRVSPHETDE